MTRTWCALLCVALVSGCAVPDLKRGKAEVDAGDMASAERDLKPLSQMGYDDAKLQLARVYAKSNDPEALQDAIALYRELLVKDPGVAVPLAKTLMADGNEVALDQALEMLLAAERRGDESAAPALLSFYADHPERDTGHRAPALAEKVARLKGPDAEAAVVKFDRRNALADPRYARELVNRCEKARDRLPECYVDLGRYYRASGSDKKLRALCNSAMGRAGAGSMPDEVLGRLGWALVSDDIPGKSLPEVAHPMLQRAAAHSSLGAVRLARLLIEYPYLDPNASPEQLLLKAANQGQPEAQLALGRLYMDGKLAPADPRKAVKYFELAAPQLPAAHYYLGRIYKRGHLGDTDVVLAARHFLTAARAGYARADYELARMFSDNRGVRPDLASAFVFASLAAGKDVPNAADVLQQIRAQMKPGQMQNAQRTLRMEVAVRETLPQALDPDQAPLPAQAQAEVMP